ncbi:MAG: hypothetical protein KDE47_24425, partial [Caldilineaceae bacterium]|nr:hypothetical protein [Caldilineaceae bacterium]
ATYLLHDVLKLNAAGESHKPKHPGQPAIAIEFDDTTEAADLEALSGSDLIALIAQKAEDLL